MDQISTPWATVHLTQLLLQCVVAEVMPEKGAEETNMPREKEVDAVVEVKNSTHVGPFQTEILEGKIPQVPTHDAHVMVMPVGCAELKWDGGHQLSPGLQVLHMYTILTAGCKQISIVVQNMTEQAIFLKKGARVVHVVSAMLAPPEEVPSRQQENAQAPKECMTVLRVTGQIVGETKLGRLE